MKIFCECGYVIRDQTDYLSYKAAFIADQDDFDLQESIDEIIEKLAVNLRQGQLDEKSAANATEQAIRQARMQFFKYARRTMYQCPECGRLLIDDLELNLQTFLPASTGTPKNLLRSYLGDKWPRHLRGHFQNGKGELWWGFGDAEQGFEQFDSWESLEHRYFEVLTRLQEEEILRNAMLSQDDEIVHQWP